jgi:hypothetical protein
VGFAFVAMGLLLALVRPSLARLQGLWRLAEAAMDWLEGASFGPHPVAVSALDLVGSTFVCVRYRQWAREERVSKQGAATPSALECLASCTLLQFCGTTLTSLFLGTVPSWLLSHTAFNALLLAWWLVFCCPGDYFFFFITRGGAGNRAVRHILEVLGLVSSAHAITSWGTDKALSCAFHANGARIAQSLWSCLLCGLLSGGAGGLATNWLGLLSTDTSRAAYTSPVTSEGPAIFHRDPRQSHAAQLAPARALLLALLYLVLTNEAGHFDALQLDRWHRTQAKVVVASLLLLQHSLLRPVLPVFAVEGYASLWAYSAKLIGVTDLEFRFKTF